MNVNYQNRGGMGQWSRDADAEDDVDLEWDLPTRSTRNTGGGRGSLRPSGGGGAASSGWGTTAASVAVQEIPEVMMTKRYIVVDAAQRNWTQQPNPYSNLIFGFGSQAPRYVSNAVTSNNPTVPLYASNSLGQLNTVPGLSNLTGWYFSNVFYPPYSPNAPPGPNCNLPADTYYVQPSGKGFGTVDQASNVTSIRIVRVILPQKQFIGLPNVPGNMDVSAIQAQVVGKPYSAFSTYPYLLLGVDTYYGDYYGANETTRRAFSALTQRTRTQTDFALDLGVQHYDYEPWGREAHRLQAPIPSLQKLTLNLSDPVGAIFTQNDNLTVALIQADASSGLYLKCFTAGFQYFSSNDLRVGDRVLFDPLTLNNMEVSPLTPSNKINFIKAMSGTPFLVVGLLDYVPVGVGGVYSPRTQATARTLPYVSSYNGFLIPNFYSNDAAGNAKPTYPEAIDGSANGSNVLQPARLVGSNLPFLNTSLQPIYTLELTCAMPDTAGFGRNIV